MQKSLQVERTQEKRGLMIKTDDTLSGAARAVKNSGLSDLFIPARFLEMSRGRDEDPRGLGEGRGDWIHLLYFPWVDSA